MDKQYHLIVNGHGFSLSNETDHDVQSDYFPGIWGIKTYKQAIKYARQELDRGNHVKVTVYTAREHELANKAIRELGLNQELFIIPAALPESKVTNGKPTNLAQLKKFLTVGYKFTVKGKYSIEEKKFLNVRETFVRETHADSVVTDLNGKKCWLYFGKASEWKFDNDGATMFWMDRDGKFEPCVRIEYLN